MRFEGRRLGRDLGFWMGSDSGLRKKRIAGVIFGEKKGEEPFPLS